MNNPLPMIMPKRPLQRCHPYIHLTVMISFVLALAPRCDPPLFRRTDGIEQWNAFERQALAPVEVSSLTEWFQRPKLFFLAAYFALPIGLAMAQTADRAEMRN